MRIACQVVEHMLRAAERWFGIDDPILLEQRSHESCEVGVTVQRRARTVKHELVLAKGPTQSGYELATEDTAQNSAGQEKARASRDPAGVVGRQPAAGHNAMDMGVSFELLSPGVQDGEEADLGPEMFRTDGHFQECGRAGFEQQGKEAPLV